MREFSWYQWILHYLGISRIVYDPVKRHRVIRINSYHPMFYVLVTIMLPFIPLFDDMNSIFDVWEDWKAIMAGDFEEMRDLWRRDDDGTYYYQSIE